MASAKQKVDALGLALQVLETQHQDISSRYASLNSELERYRQVNRSIQRLQSDLMSIRSQVE